MKCRTVPDLLNAPLRLVADQWELYLMQYEAAAVRFSHKMILEERSGMLGIDLQRMGRRKVSLKRGRRGRRETFSPVFVPGQKPT